MFQKKLNRISSDMEAERAMSEIKPKRLLSVLAIMCWMTVNILFMVLELTAFSDASVLNNSILLILWLSSLGALLLMRKWGAAFAISVLIYAFSFNAFNIIYFPETAILNGFSGIINAVAVIVMFRGIFENKFK